MFEFFSKLFDTSDYPARWSCGNWGAFEGWLHIVSDTVIFLAYFAIPVVLVYLWRKHKSKIMDELRWSIILFAAFILCCGFGHLIDAGIFWNPIYRFLGLIKAITAVVSTITAIHLATLIKKMMLLKSRAEWEAKNEELIAKNKELEKFAYITSHDLKSPVRAISNLTQWIQDKIDCREDEELQQYLELLISRSERMNGLIEGILEYSRIGRFEVQREHHDLNEIVVEVMGDYPKVKFDVDRLPVCYCNRTRMNQLFTNLIHNSFIHAARDDVEVRIKYSFSEQFHRFDILDNGTGIDPKYHDKVFELFQTLKPRDELEVVGIGLTLCKKIVEGNGGEIKLEPFEGGAHIWFTFPRKEQ